MTRHVRVVCVESVWNYTIRHFSATPMPTIKVILRARWNLWIGMDQSSVPAAAGAKRGLEHVAVIGIATMTPMLRYLQNGQMVHGNGRACSHNELLLWTRHMMTITDRNNAMIANLGQFA